MREAEKLPWEPPLLRSERVQETLAKPARATDASGRGRARRGAVNPVGGGTAM
jgi:hypothetical protein